jgi:hypothetical protein
MALAKLNINAVDGKREGVPDREASKGQLQWCAGGEATEVALGGAIQQALEADGRRRMRAVALAGGARLLESPPAA